MRIIGLILAVIGTLSGLLLAVTLNGWFIDLGAHGQIALVLFAGTGVVLFLPVGAVLWFGGLFTRTERAGTDSEDRVRPGRRRSKP